MSRGDKWLSGSLYDFLRGPMGLGVPKGAPPGVNGICEEVRDFCDFLDDLKPGDMAAMFGPRGTVKTTILEGWCVREICRDRNFNVFWGSATTKNPEGSGRSVAFHLDGRQAGSQVAGLYGSDLAFAGTPWSESEGYLVQGITRPAKDNTLDFLTVNRGLKGRHARVILWDDPHQDEKTETAIHDTVERVRQSMDLMTGDCIFLVCGTFWHKMDFLSRAFRGEFGEVKKYHRAAYKKHPDGTFDYSALTYPQNRPAHVLDKIRGRQTPSHFARQYLGEITADDDCVYDVEKHYRVWTELPNVQQMRRYITLDPASGQIDGDKTGCCVWGVPSNAMLYQLDWFEEAIPIQEGATRTIALACKWEVPEIGVERGPLAAAWKAALEDAMRRLGRFPLLTPLTHGKIRKQDRAERVAGRFDNGGVLFHPKCEAMKTQMREMTRTRGPIGPDDNLVDCYSMTWELIHYPTEFKPERMLTAREGAVDEMLKLALPPAPNERPWVRDAYKRIHTEQSEYGGHGFLSGDQRQPSGPGSRTSGWGRH